MSGETTNLASVVNSVLAVACSCLADSLGETPGTCKIYHTKPPDDCCDFLAVWVERVRPTVKFPADYAGAASDGSGLHAMADIAIEIKRSCWPVISDNATNPFPPVEQTDAATLSLLDDAAHLWCCVMAAAQNGTISGDCSDVRVGALEPLAPKGGCAGWIMRLSVELDTCC